MYDELLVPSTDELNAILNAPVPDPYTGADWDGIQDEDALETAPEPVGFVSLAASPKIAGNSTKEAAHFLTYQRIHNANWYRRCLQLQRIARDVPALASTAYTASVMTPANERVPQVAKLRRGMIAYTKGVDPSGHVFYILGRRPGYDQDDPNGVLTESNDVTSTQGHVGIVSLSFYTIQWGHKFQFGATWLNGYDFSDFNAAPKPVYPSLGKNYEHAIADLKKALKSHKGDKNRHTYNLIANDIARMTKRYERLSKKK
jgi:hypothetical protein